MNLAKERRLFLMVDLTQILSEFDEQRFLENFKRMAGDPETPRLAYTKGEEERHRTFRTIMEEIGVEASSDFVGNTTAMVGKNKKPRVIIGSHLDNIGVGLYDGVLGVAVGIEVLACLKDKKTGNPVGACAFTAEESTRFGYALIGSSIITGALTLDRIKKLTDENGVSLYDSIKLLEYEPDRIHDCIWDPDSVKLFIEPHMEQGPVLYNEGLTVGIVNSIATPARYTFILGGTDNHSGTTSIAYGRDAMDCLAEMTLAREQITKEAEQEYNQQEVIFRSRISDGRVYDPSPNKIAGDLEFDMDIRGNKLLVRDLYQNLILNRFKEIAERRKINITIKENYRKSPVESMNQDIYLQAADLAHVLGIPHKVMPSGASHDAVNIHHYGPPALVLFGDSVGGLSHNKHEHTTEKSMIDLCRLTLVCAYHYAMKGG